MPRKVWGVRSLNLAAVWGIALIFAGCNNGDETDNTTQNDGGSADAGGGSDAGESDAGGHPTDNPCEYTEQTIPIPKIHTPRWAFEPWISKDISTGADTYDFVKGFKDRDIPVGVVVIDSPWETNYNTFKPNPDRYPDFEKMVADMHAQNVRVVLWVTQMINEKSWDAEPDGDTYPRPSPNLQKAKECNYLVNDGELYTWWKGRGAGLDFMNPHAVIWWHRQQDDLMAIGLDGWKLDFGESYISTDPVKTYKGDVPHQEYSETYYRDYWEYGVYKRGSEDFVTMVRPYDKSYDFEGRFFARPENAPVCWVGDNMRNWDGLKDALDHIFRSAKKGYVVIGSDIGGYLDRNDESLLDPSIPFSQEVFVRWTALGALTPFMQLHGRANITPWTVPDKPEETVEIYRYWATLHHELLPFYYSLAEEAYTGGETIIRPIGDEAEWPDDYRYQLGSAFLVAPILDDTGKRDMVLPAGAKWYDWWKPEQAAYSGGTTLPAYDTGEQKIIPLFVREGAIIPLYIDNDVTGIGTEKYSGYLTWLIWPGDKESEFKLRDDDDVVRSIAVIPSEGDIKVQMSAYTKPAVLHIYSEKSCTAISNGSDGLKKYDSLNSWLNGEAGWFFDESKREIKVRVGKFAEETTVTIKF